MSKDCVNNKPCGCEDQPLSSPPPCESGTQNCPDPDPCPETFAAGCLVYMEDTDLTCGQTVIATKGDRLPTILERMISIFCGAAVEGAVNLLSPSPDSSIGAVDDQIISVDRVNCTDTITFIPVGSPPGMLFDYEDKNGALITGQANVILAPEQSTVLFNIDGTAVGAGTYTFDLVASVCGSVLTVPVSVTI